ncbi:MAG: M18 family aminopeptidase [Defluviitaleaceae bacterium]|nr:M18 family aminopeptidase [Defluviitaleaceae bacterium]
MENAKVNARDMLEFIDFSPTPYHAVSGISERLTAQGFEHLSENEIWNTEIGGKYFVRKNDSSLLAFIIGNGDLAREGIRAICAHTDSPSFIIKPNCEMRAGGYLKLNTAPYGGPIMNTWFDRSLAIAGQVSLQSNDTYAPQKDLINFFDPLLVIPNLAIHMNREVNNGVKINPQSDTLPLAGFINRELERDNYLERLICSNLNCSADDILDFDLRLYEQHWGNFTGCNDEFISSGRLDDLWMVYAAMEAFVNAEVGAGIKMVYFPDNEEIGSMTSHGAHSAFLENCIKRIYENHEDYCRAMANSFFISADLAHAQNPNYMDKDDPTTKAILGGGPVLKYSASQRYATNATTAAIFAALCKKAQVPMQKYITRSDVLGGGTIGSIMAANLGTRVVDMGAPVLAMHSIRELGAVADNEYVLKLFNTFFA